MGIRLSQCPFFGFLKKQFSRRKFGALFLIALLFGFIYILSLLGGIIENLVNSDIIISMDKRTEKLLFSFRNDNLVQFFSWLTVLGEEKLVLGFVGMTTGLLWFWRQRIYIVPLLITVMGAEIFTAISKIIVHRPRPELAVYAEDSFSFPSGHSTVAVAFYGFLTYILLKIFPKWRTKINVFFSGLTLILLIGFSRLYLGVHYVSDVWGGFLVGALWLIIGISLTEFFLAIKK